MALPENVQKQADESNRLLKEAIEADEADKNSIDNQEEEPILEPEIDWEHKYNVLQGKYDSEIPKSNTDLNSLKEREYLSQKKIDDLEAKITELTSKPEVKTDFSEVRDVLGDEAADIFKKQQSDIDTYKASIEDLKKQIGSVGMASQQSSEQMFYSNLSGIVPEYEKINANPKWLSWLSKLDVYSGKTRQALLNEAASSLDANRVAAFFQQWTKEKVTRKKPDIQKQVAPSTSSSSSTIEEGKKWSPNQISAFFKDAAKGKYKHDPDLMQKIKADILRAQAEGRIIAN